MFEELLEHFKENFMNMVTSRLLVLMIVIMGMGGYLISRIFQLQIVDGEEYYNNFQLKITKESCHLERRRATRCKKNLLATSLLFDPFVAFLGEFTVTTDLLIIYGLTNIGQLGSHKGGLIKIYHLNTFIRNQRIRLYTRSPRHPSVQNIKRPPHLS